METLKSQINAVSGNSQNHKGVAIEAKPERDTGTGNVHVDHGHHNVKNAKKHADKLRSS